MVQFEAARDPDMRRLCARTSLRHVRSFRKIIPHSAFVAGVAMDLGSLLSDALQLGSWQ